MPHCEKPLQPLLNARVKQYKKGATQNKH